MTSILVFSDGELIGDGLIKLPLLAGLRAAWPEARLAWATGVKSVYAGALQPIAGQLLDEVFEGLWPELQWPALLWKRPLGGRHFDVVIDTQMRFHRLLRLKRIAHDRYLSSCAGYRFSSARPKEPVPLGGPVLDRLYELGSLAGRPIAPGAVPAARGEWAEAAAALLPSGPRYIGLAPGAGGKQKCWPRERYLELAQRLAGLGFVPVLLLGPQEADWVPWFRAAVPQARFPEWDRTDAWPQAKGPLLVMALARRLQAAVANDAGTGHMLAAGGAPLVSLLSDRRKMAKFRPAARRLRMLAADHWGSGMAAIPLEDVLAAVLELAACKENE